MRTNPIVVAILMPVALAWVLLRAMARATLRAIGWTLLRLASVLKRAWVLIGPPVRRVAGLLAQVVRTVVRTTTPVLRLLVRAVQLGLRSVGRCVVAGWRLLRPVAVAAGRRVRILVRHVGPPAWRAICLVSLAVTVLGELIVAGSVLLLGKPMEVALGVVIAFVRPLAAAISVAAGIVLGAFRAAVAALRALVGQGGPGGPDTHVAAAGAGTVADRRLTATFLVHVLLASVLLGLVALARDRLTDGGGAMALLAIVAIVHASGATPLEHYGRALSGFLVAAVAVGIATTPAPAVSSDPLGAALSLAAPGLPWFLVGGIVGWIGGDELEAFMKRVQAEEADRAVEAERAESPP